MVNEREDIVRDGEPVGNDGVVGRRNVDPARSDDLVGANIPLGECTGRFLQTKIQPIVLKPNAVRIHFVARGPTDLVPVSDDLWVSFCHRSAPRAPRRGRTVHAGKMMLMTAGAQTRPWHILEGVYDASDLTANVESSHLLLEGLGDALPGGTVGSLGLGQPGGFLDLGRAHDR
jgi:hypothetical protein